MTIGDDALISRFAVVQSVGGSVHIGHRSGVGDFCNLYGQGVLTIGNDVLIASGVRIHTAEHNFEGRDVAIRSQGETVASTVIGDGAWLGANVVIVAGVHVGDGAVVAAGAVVTQDVAAYTVVGGVPARLLKRRPSEGCA